MTIATARDLEVEDGRSDLPIFIHSELDDLDLTLEGFRVYAHLARRAGKDNHAWPSYNSMGEACFRKSYPNASHETLRRKAIAAVKELAEAGLIVKLVICNDRGEHATNHYRLTPRCEWGGGSVNTLGVVSTHHGSVNAPKDTPLEDTPLEGTPKEGREAAAPPSVHPSSLPEGIFPSVNGKETDTNQTARAPSPPVAVAPPSPLAQAYEDILGLPLSLAHREQILCAALPLPDMLVALRVWKQSDYNPTNIAGILELAADPKRARWKLGKLELEKGEDAPRSYQPDILPRPVAVAVDEATELPFVPDTPPLDDVTWPVADDPLKPIWRNSLRELTQFAQLKGSSLVAGIPEDGIPVYVVQVAAARDEGDERAARVAAQDAAWLNLQAQARIKRVLQVQIEGDFILAVAA